jgi:hypothetical protein
MELEAAADIDLEMAAVCNLSVSGRASVGTGRCLVVSGGDTSAFSALGPKSLKCACGRESVCVRASAAACASTAGEVKRKT